ncbi:hypothetical protein ACU4GI_10155 [Cupriavidus basilensis]
MTYRGIERWWLEVTGKGSTPRRVPATDELIAALRSLGKCVRWCCRYRPRDGFDKARHTGRCTCPDLDVKLEKRMSEMTLPRQPFGQDLTHDFLDSRC